MKPIEQADFLEMRWMPFVFGLIILMTLRSVVFGEMSNVVDLFAVYSYFGTFSIGSFWYRLYQYGHNLDPHAPMHIKPFTPLLIGVKQIANFREYSFPLARRLSARPFRPAHRARRVVFAQGGDEVRACADWGAHAPRVAMASSPSRTFARKAVAAGAEPACERVRSPDLRCALPNEHSVAERCRSASMQPRLTRRFASKRACTQVRS